MLIQTAIHHRRIITESTVAFGIMVGIAIGIAGSSLALSTPGCATHADPAPAVDVGNYAARQIACVEREATDPCRADVAACKTRIDDCRAAVKKEFGR